MTKFNINFEASKCEIFFSNTQAQVDELPPKVSAVPKAPRPSNENER